MKTRDKPKDTAETLLDALVRRVILETGLRKTNEKLSLPEAEAIAKAPVAIRIEFVCIVADFDSRFNNGELASRENEPGFADLVYVIRSVAVWMMNPLLKKTLPFDTVSLERLVSSVAQHPLPIKEQIPYLEGVTRQVEAFVKSTKPSGSLLVGINKLRDALSEGQAFERRLAARIERAVSAGG